MSRSDFVAGYLMTPALLYRVEKMRMAMIMMHAEDYFIRGEARIWSLLSLLAFVFGSELMMKKRSGLAAIRKGTIVLFPLLPEFKARQASN